MKCIERIEELYKYLISEEDKATLDMLVGRAQRKMNEIYNFDDKKDMCYENGEFKIGKFAKLSLLKFFSEHGSEISATLLNKLTDVEQSKRLFGLYFPLLVEDSNNVKNFDRKRYYKPKEENAIVINDKRYLLCSQWISNNSRDKIVYFIEKGWKSEV